MTDREKLIDLIINAKRTDPETGSFTEYLADFLLGYGVKLPDDRPVSREQVEKVWRAHWNESTHLGGFVYCSRCGYNALEANNYTFCPKCGSPFTDEAVQMEMERLEALHGE